MNGFHKKNSYQKLALTLSVFLLQLASTAPWRTPVNRESWEDSEDPS